MIKTTSVVSRFVVIAVVAGVAMFGLNQLNAARTDKEEYVSIIVEFDPPQRTPDTVRIIVTVDGHKTIDTETHTSPWRPDGGGMWVPKGAEIGVNAQQLRDGRLSCIIMGTGGKLLSLNQRDDMGSIRCWYNRKR